MVQFLSINFFSWICSIFVGFFKSSHFFVSPYTSLNTTLSVGDNQQHVSAMYSHLQAEYRFIIGKMYIQRHENEC